jgi:hypothetical protein
LKRDDEAAAEIERKNAEFNANANEVISTYMALESEKSKFESRMADKEAELAAEQESNSEKLAAGEAVNDAKELLLNDYVDVYRQAIEGL